MPSRTAQQEQMVKWGIIGVAVILILMALWAVGGEYLGASLLGPDVTQRYRPLVRHQISQQHAYDDGSLFSENQGFSKEFTLGYAFHKKVKAVESLPLYSCADLRTLRFSVTTNPQECKAQGFRRVYPLGWIATTNSIEAPATLYRCLNASSGDVLLTDDGDECALVAGYGEPEILGYIASAGHLPQRRLNDLCDVVATQCRQSATGVIKPICDVQAGLCKGPR